MKDLTVLLLSLAAGPAGMAARGLARRTVGRVVAATGGRVWLRG